MSIGKTGRIWIALAVVAGLLAGCGGDEDQGAEGQLSVVTTTSVLSSLTEKVGGDLVAVEPLMGPGVDPHTFELTPGDVRAVADADLVFFNGIGLDDYLMDDVESANDAANIVIVTDGIDLLESEDHEDEAEKDQEEDDHDHGAFDPHVWLDPIRVEMMVDNIADALAGADPDNASIYRNNATAYRETLEETDRQIRALIDEIPEDHRKLVTNHDAFEYFARRYGLEIIGTVIPGTSSEADPSASDIAELTQLIEEENVRAIFAEALIDPKVAESLASDTGVEIVYGLYTGQVGEEGSGAETVDGMLLANAEKISEALR
ncbi:MAG: metal ABC transporter substrate-binding protein [Thermomicrobiales bacterium]